MALSIRRHGSKGGSLSCHRVVKTTEWNKSAWLREVFYRQQGFSLRLLGEDAYIIRKELAEEVKGGEEIPEGGKPPQVTPVREPEGSPEVEVTPAEEGPFIRIIARIPWDRLSDFMSGVLPPLRNAGAEVNLRVELTAQSWISRCTRRCGRSGRTWRPSRPVKISRAAAHLPHPIHPCCPCSWRRWWCRPS